MFTKNKKIISMILIFIFMFLVVSPVNAIKDSFTIIGETEEENEFPIFNFTYKGRKSWLKYLIFFCFVLSTNCGITWASALKNRRFYHNVVQKIFTKINEIYME